jgi:hypothetical protein
MDLLNQLPGELYIILLSYLDYAEICMLKTEKITWYQIITERWGYCGYKIEDIALKFMLLLESLISDELGVIRTKFLPGTVGYGNLYLIDIVIERVDNNISLCIKNLYGCASYNILIEGNITHIQLCFLEKTLVSKMILLHAKLA